LGAVVDGFGEGGVDVELGVRVDVEETVTTVVVDEGFTEVVKVLVDDEVLVELATPGMHWPGDVSDVCSISRKEIVL
jgi:hypothetical protein